MPDHRDFVYTFENLTNVVEQLVEKLGLTSYSLYVMDYGAPIGYRLALRHPERVKGLIVQNGNAYEEGLLEFWDPIKKYWKDPTPENREAIRFLVDAKSTKWQYENGVSDRTLLDPTTWVLDQVGLDRPGNAEIQLDLFHSYQSNVPLYPEFQAFFRKYQPPTLIVWGKNDFIFPPEGAAPTRATSIKSKLIYWTPVTSLSKRMAKKLLAASKNFLNRSNCELVSRPKESYEHSPGRYGRRLH
jgi:pimeloyl-ACP methyl ester carboxylesterase